jgi:hypothetical protein
VTLEGAAAFAQELFRLPVGTSGDACKRKRCHGAERKRSHTKHDDHGEHPLPFSAFTLARRSDVSVLAA